MTNKEAIEKLERHKMMNCHGCVHPSMVGWCEKHCQLPEAFDMAINALEAQEWVPAKKLPEKDGSYLVSGRWGSGKEMVGECEYKVHDGYFSTAWNFDVLAWKPLPEPYREGK